MTIALGILASDGAVIAADSQESGGYPGSLKTDVLKILSSSVSDAQGSSKRALAVSGAGSAGYLDSVHQEMHVVFQHEPDQRKFNTTIRKTVREFYHQHVLPLHVLGASQPMADLVIGLSWRNSQPSLLATEHSTLRRCKEYVAIGAGREHAAMLLGRIYPQAGVLSVQRAAYLAAYIVFHVKQFVDGCGGKTHVAMLRDGDVEMLSDEQLQYLEARFSDYLDFDALAVNYICGRAVRDEVKAMATLGKYLKIARKNTLELPDLTLASRGWSLDWDYDEKPPRILRHTSPVSFEP